MPMPERKTNMAAGGTLVLCLAIAVFAGVSPGKDPRVRLALSAELFADFNENDAHAAVKAWAEAVAKPSHLELDGDPQIMSSEDIVRAIANRRVDAFSITSAEYVKVSSFVDASIYSDAALSKTGVEYLILVKEDSGIHDLAGLQGRSLLIYRHVTMCLAAAWLETQLAGAKLESSDRFFSSVVKSSKVSQTVLPVYFGRADACLVTRRDFDTMAELNPQVRQRLRSLAVSPKLIVALTGMHKDCSAEMKGKIRDAVTGLGNTPIGRQILTLFQSERLVPVDVSLLRSAVELETAYDRLNARRMGDAR